MVLHRGYKMPREYGPSVYQFNFHDCWRTLFLEECEDKRLFGATADDLKYIKAVPYQPGTVIYFEDAPYFNEHKIHHRVCGPYQVVATTQMPRDGKCVHAYNDKIIVYKEARPELGPWLNRTSDRVIEGDRTRVKQMASHYEYFPFRFRVKRHDHYKVQLITHEVNCTLCSRPYDNSVFGKKYSLRRKPRIKLIKNK